MTAAHYKGGHHPGNDLGLHYTAWPPIAASCPYSDQLLVTRKFWSPGPNRPTQARSGHDILQMSDWYVAAQTDNLEPVDELVTSLIKEHGKLLLGSEYIGRQKGRWIAVPTGVQTTGQTPCARIDHFKQFVGLDLTKMYPAGAPPDEVLAEAWTWDG